MAQKIKIGYTAPTEAYPFFSDVKVNLGNGWRRIVENPTDGRPQGPALFPTREQMIAGIRKVVKAA